MYVQFSCHADSCISNCSRYQILAELGDGTSGIVYKAIHMETSEIVRDFLNYVPSANCFLELLVYDLYFVPGCCQKNEEKVLLLGRMCKSARS